MESWQLSPRYLENHAPSYSSMELLPTKLINRHLFPFTPDVCLVSQLKRRSFVSLHDLISSARTSSRSIPVEFFSVVGMLDEDLESKDVKINLKQ